MSGGGKVTLNWEARIDQVLKEMQRLQGQNTRLEQRIKGVSRSSARGSRQAVAGLQNWFSGVTRMAGSYMGAERAIQAVTTALEAQERVAERSATEKVTVANAQRKMLRNLGNVSDEEQSEFLAGIGEDVRKLAPQGGLAATYEDLAGALSALGADRKAARENWRAAARLVPDDATDRAAFLEALSHVSKATGSKNPYQNMGLIMALAEQAAVKDLDKISTNLVPGVIGVAQHGGTAQQASALIAAITQGSADTEGRRSKTAAIQLAKQLAEAFPEEDLFEWETNRKTGGSRRKLAAPGTGLKTTDERIEYLREHPAARERFLGNMSIETAQLAAVMQLLGGQPSADLKRATGGKSEMTYGAYMQARAALDMPLSEMARRSETKIRQMELPAAQHVAATHRRLATTGEALEETTLGKNRAAQGLYTTARLEELLERSGNNPFDVTWRGLRMKFTLPQNRSSKFKSILDERIDELLNETTGYTSVGHIPKTRPTKDPARIEAARVLQQELDRLDEIDGGRRRGGLQGRPDRRGGREPGPIDSGEVSQASPAGPEDVRRLVEQNQAVASALQESNRLMGEQLAEQRKQTALMTGGPMRTRDIPSPLVIDRRVG